MLAYGLIVCDVLVLGSGIRVLRSLLPGLLSYFGEGFQEFVGGAGFSEFGLRFWV